MIQRLKSIIPSLCFPFFLTQESLTDCYKPTEVSMFSVPVICTMKRSISMTWQLLCRQTLLMLTCTARFAAHRALYVEASCPRCASVWLINVWWQSYTHFPFHSHADLNTTKCFKEKKKRRCLTLLAKITLNEICFVGSVCVCAKGCVCVCVSSVWVRVR